MKAEKLLQLAESMAAKQLRQGGAAEGYEAVMLYLHVLQEQDKAREALQAMQGPLGAAVALPEARHLLMATLTVRACAHGECVCFAGLTRLKEQLNSTVMLTCERPMPPCRQRPVTGLRQQHFSSKPP